MSDIKEKAEAVNTDQNKAVEDDQDFEAAFAEFSGSDNAAEKDAIPEEDNTDSNADQDKPVVAAVPAKDDLDKTVGTQQDTDWKAEAEKLRAENDQLQHRTRSDSGRISSFQKELDTYKEKEKAAADKAAAAKTAAEENDPELSTFDEEFPDISKPVKKLLEKSREQTRGLQDKITNLEKDAQETAAEKRYSQMDSNHSDWRSVVQTPEYRNWVNAQPDFIQEVVMSNAERLVDANRASAVLTLFKEHQATKKPSSESDVEKDPAESAADLDSDRQQDKSQKLAEKRQRQLDSSATVSGGRGATSGPPEDFEAAFNFYAKQK